MKPIISKILVYFTLALLAAFLFFWLQQEYKDEQSALQNEHELNVARELFNISGIDFNHILKDLGQTSDSVSITLDIDAGPYENRLQHLKDSIHQIRSMMKVRYSKDQMISNRKGGDSIDVVEDYHQTNIGDMAIIYTTDEEMRFGEDDSLSFSSISNFEQALKGGLAVNASNISKIALKNIWPKIFFAFFLFGLMTLGIYLLQKSYQEQQLLLENKNNLISNITHELKTPVATIGVALEAIQDFNVQDNPAKANSYIDLSRKELKRLSSSIDQVMQLSKMDSKHEIYQFENLELLPLCQEVASHLQLQSEQKKIRLIIHDQAKKLKAKLDATHFKRMLFNLIDNSLKYGKEGGEINLKFEEKNDEIEMSISDDGIGIPKKYHPKLFDRFFRVPHGNQHNVNGYGLGLSYVKEIVDVHQWKIQINSTEAEGTTVSIKIPSIHV